MKNKFLLNRSGSLAAASLKLLIMKIDSDTTRDFFIIEYLKNRHKEIPETDLYDYLVDNEWDWDFYAHYMEMMVHAIIFRPNVKTNLKRLITEYSKTTK